MNLSKRNDVRRARRVILFALAISAALYVAPVVTLLYVACGLIDVRRHRKVSYKLVETYFMGNGIMTWLLSPINLFADLLSLPNKGQYALADLPAAHRAEITACAEAFVDNGERIKAHVARTLGGRKRCMLAFKWYDAAQAIDLDIPAFQRDYRTIKTIAVSVFNTREQTSWHFGPLRLTFRVLYNLCPIDGAEAYIGVDDKVHYWKDGPLFIFDDTMFHQSVNSLDYVRYCLFMDIVRPNYAERVFAAMIHAVSVISGAFKRLFYRNWAFVR